MKIKEGGQTSELKSELVEINTETTCYGAIRLTLVDKDDNKSESILTLDEARELAYNIKSALKDIINRI